MDASIHRSIPPLPYAEADRLVDRRRPSRADADMTLVPLLREAGHSEFTEFATGPCSEPLGTRSVLDPDNEGNVLKGIMFGLVLSMPFWLVTALVGAMILR